MNKPRLLPALALLGLAFLACDQVEPSPTTCTVTGQVTIEGKGITGVSVTLSNGASTATNANGHFRFENVEGGSITVTISGPSIPSDATFDMTSAATVTCDGQLVTINFTGSHIRTARILGTVTIDNTALAGATVVLAGTFHDVATTDEDGAFAFGNLRAGSYTIEIPSSAFDSDEIRFPSTRSGFTLGVDEVKVVSFNGTYLRTAGIRGRVSAADEGLDSVTVNVTGGEDSADLNMVTDSASSCRASSALTTSQLRRPGSFSAFRAASMSIRFSIASSSSRSAEPTRAATGFPYRSTATRSP